PARSALAAPPALAVPRLLPLAGLDPGVRRAVAAVLVTAAALLAFHVRTYAFLCDDAFISFRYARNFAHGHGLVFNPGFERVEGYSNFLWVVVLAGLDRLGLEPPRASLLLSWASTLLLWGLVVAFAARWAPRRGSSPGAARSTSGATPAACCRSRSSWARTSRSGASTTARGSRTRTTPRLAGAPGGTRASSTWRRSRSSTPCGCGRRSSCWAAWRSRARTGPTCRRCSPR